MRVRTLRPIFVDTLARMIVQSSGVTDDTDADDTKAYTSVTVSRIVQRRLQRDDTRDTGASRGRAVDGRAAFPTLNRSKIAALSGLSNSAVTRILRGDRWPSQVSAEKIATILRLKLSDFLQEIAHARNERNDGRDGRGNSGRPARSKQKTKRTARRPGRAT